MTMLSKDHADAVAEAMRSQNRLAGDRFPYRRGVPLAVGVRCPELRALPAAARPEVVREATTQVMKTPLFIGLMLACVAAFAVCGIVCATWLAPTRARDAAIECLLDRADRAAADLAG
jgi:hypothetical protein